MVSILVPGLMEGQSNTKPPYFDGKEYVLKNKMKAFLRSRDPLQWDVVERGINPTAASTSNKNGKDKEIKLPALMSRTEMSKREALDAKAIYFLYCVLSPGEYNIISSCGIAKEVWNRFYVTYEGTDCVKETKVNILLDKYESFKMKR